MPSEEVEELGVIVHVRAELHHLAEDGLVWDEDEAWRSVWGELLLIVDELVDVALVEGLQGAVVFQVQATGQEPRRQGSVPDGISS